MDDASLFAVTPYPGTPFYRQLAGEGRLLEEEPRSQFRWSKAVFSPKQMTAEDLEHGVQRAYDLLYPHFRKRLKRVLLTQIRHLFRSPRLALAIIGGNLRRVGIEARSETAVTSGHFLDT